MQSKASNQDFFLIDGNVSLIDRFHYSNSSIIILSKHLLIIWAFDQQHNSLVKSINHSKLIYFPPFTTCLQFYSGKSSHFVFSPDDLHGER